MHRSGESNSSAIVTIVAIIAIVVLAVAAFRVFGNRQADTNRAPDINVDLNDGNGNGNPMY